MPQPRETYPPEGRWRSDDIVHAVRVKLGPAGHELDNVELLVNDGARNHFFFEPVYDLDCGELIQFGYRGLG